MANKLPIPFRNDSGEEMPPLAAFQVNGTVDDAGQILKAIKPTGSASSSLIFFNGPTSVPINGYGATSADTIVKARYNSGGGSVAALGGAMGAVASQWYLDNTGEGFVSISDATPLPIPAVTVIRQGGGGSALIRGVLDGDLTSGGTATVSIYSWNGSAWADSGTNATSVRAGLPTTATIEATKVVWMTIQAGAYFIVIAEC